ASARSRPASASRPRSPSRPRGSTATRCSRWSSRRTSSAPTPTPPAETSTCRCRSPTDPLHSRTTAMNAISRALTASLLAFAVHPGTAQAATPAPDALQTAANAATIDGDHIVTADGVRLYYKDWGPKDGPVVTLSHGWPLNSDSWESQMLFLAGNGYR